MNTAAKTTIAVSITEELDALVRAEAIAQDRPISWVVESLLRSALGRAKKPAGHLSRKPARSAKHQQKVLHPNRHHQPAHGAGRNDGGAA